MLNEVEIQGINQTDKVFKYENVLVKIRLLKKEITQNDKLFGPSAFSLHLTASVCDKKGKAIPRGDGKYCILPHTVTIPVTALENGNETLKGGLKDILGPLIKQAVSWHNNLNVMETLVSEWETPSPKKSLKTKSKSN